MFKAIANPDPRREELNDLVRIGRLSWASFRRHRWLIVLTTVLTIGLGAAYLALRGEAYTASSRILVDNRVLALTQQDAIYSVSSLTTQLMQSQVEILRSENIARRVINELDLVKDPDFETRQSRFGSSPPAPAGTSPDGGRELRGALGSFQKRLAVEQVGQSYVVEIRITASAPERAAQITNSLVAAYLDDQTAVNGAVAQSASGWLRSHVSSLGTTARVLTAATAPLTRDGPAAPMILGFAAFCGLIIGTGLAFCRDLFMREIRTTDAVQAACGAECFGILPAIEAKQPRWTFWRRNAREAQGEAADGVVAKAASLDWAIEQPRSLFAHSLRRTRAALFNEPSSGAVIVGVTSVHPREGKTVVAGNLARVAASWGKKVLLIDAVPYNSQLTKLLAPRAERGLYDALRGVPPSNLLLRDRWTNMHFLPGLTESAAQAGVGLVSKATEMFLAQIKPHYDLVILDLPPLTPVSDVHELAHLLDKILLVVEWGRSNEEEVAAALANSGAVHRKLAGAVLNKANLRELQKFSNDWQVAGGAEYAAYVSDRRQRPSSPLAEPVTQTEQTQRPQTQEPAIAGRYFWQGKKINADLIDGKGAANESL